jgi:hypothetical protein
MNQDSKNQDVCLFQCFVRSQSLASSSSLQRRESIEIKEKKTSKSLFKKDKSSKEKVEKSNSVRKLSAEKPPERAEPKTVTICDIVVPLDNTIKWRQPLAEVDSRGTIGS